MAPNSRFLWAVALLAWQSVPLLAQTINEKIVLHCKSQLGKKVGDGECSALAAAALKAARAKPFRAYKDSPLAGDYVWGRLVYLLAAKEGRLQEKKAAGETILAGDVIQMGNVKLERKTASGGFKFHAFPHHTAVVAAWKEKGRALTVFEQNINGKRQVMMNTYRYDDLKTGWIRIYRPMPANAGK